MATKKTKKEHVNEEIPPPAPAIPPAPTAATPPAVVLSRSEVTLTDEELQQEIEIYGNRADLALFALLKKLKKG